MSSYSDLSRKVSPMSGDGFNNDGSRKIELTAELYKDPNKRVDTNEGGRKEPTNHANTIMEDDEGSPVADYKHML